jgi:hypothetical protein
VGTNLFRQLCEQQWPISTGCLARTSRGRHRRAWSTETIGPSPVLFRVVRSFSLADPVCLLGKLHRYGNGGRPLASGADPRAAVLNTPPRAARLSACRRWADALSYSPLFFACRVYSRCTRGTLALGVETSPRFVGPIQFVDDARRRQTYTGRRGCVARRQGTHLSKP